MGKRDSYNFVIFMSGESYISLSSLMCFIGFQYVNLVYS